MLDWSWFLFHWNVNGIRLSFRRFIVDGAHVIFCALVVGSRQIKASTGTENNRGGRGVKDTHIWRQSLIGHCTTVSQYGFSHVPALCIILPSLSLRFLHCSSSFRILWTGAKNQGSATIQQIKLGDQGAVIRGVWGQTAMPSDSEKAIIILVCFSPPPLPHWVKLGYCESLGASCLMLC